MQTFQKQNLIFQSRQNKRTSNLKPSGEAWESDRFRLHLPHPNPLEISDMVPELDVACSVVLCIIIPPGLSLKDQILKEDFLLTHTHTYTHTQSGRQVRTFIFH